MLEEPAFCSVGSESYDTAAKFAPEGESWAYTAVVAFVHGDLDIASYFARRAVGRNRLWGQWHRQFAACVNAELIGLPQF